MFLHRWLGFISGLVVFIVSITGCIYCFQDEVQDAFFAHRNVTPLANTPFLQPSELKASAQSMYPKGIVSAVIYGNERRSAQVRIIVNKRTRNLYFNPYTGALLHDEDFKSSFFPTIKAIHLYCFFPREIGHWVVSISVLVFIIIMISGLILWWPKKKSDRKRAFTIKWNGRWRRVNYDLHNVLGFYATFIAIILAITGLAISWDWVSDGLYNAVNLGKHYPDEKQQYVSDTTFKHPMTAGLLDSSYTFARKHSGNHQMMLIFWGPKSNATLLISTFPQVGHYSYADNFVFDRYNGKVLQNQPYAAKSPGLKFNGMNYDIHVGQIGGLTTRLMAFLASLICASLPVTGLILYIGKKKKKTTPRAKPSPGLKKQPSMTEN